MGKKRLNRFKLCKRAAAVIMAAGLVLEAGVPVMAGNENLQAGTESFFVSDEGLGTGYIEPEREADVEVCSESEYCEREYELLTASPESQQSAYRTELLPEIKHQGNYGVCWAFSTIACMEINLMKKGYTDVDLSELHLAYYTYHSAADVLGGFEGDYYTYSNDTTSFLQMGGNYVWASNALMDWLGAAAEETVPYSMASQVETEGLPEETAYKTVAHLQQLREIPTADKEAVKEAIVEYGAVMVSYYAITSYSSNKYYNADTAGYYVPEETGTNHAVVIVGWDDDYSASNFPTEPEGNGAWIVRNSWGSGYGEDGYFYLSYYDKSLTTIAAAFEAEMSDDYDNNYQYDGSLRGRYSSYGSDIKEANVFQIKANASGTGKETLEAVSFETPSVSSKYTVKIYKNLKNLDNPESGELCATMSGEVKYSGIYTVPLTESVEMSQGTYYSVVVCLTRSDGKPAYITEDYSDTDFYVTVSSAAEHQSYRYNGYFWEDYGKDSNANYRIKAYTNNVVDNTDDDNQDEGNKEEDKENEDVAPTGITLNSATAEIEIDEEIQLIAEVEPENATNKSVKWSSSDETVATVTETGVVTGVKEGQAVITAATFDEKYSAQCVVTVKGEYSGYTGMITTEDGRKYWYEDGVLQGTEGRGKEIYDPETDAWYWLDAIQGGAVATSKDVYQESWAGEYADNEDGTGKWVRYDEEGHMIKGWSTTEAGTYYFDEITGAMAKGEAYIGNVTYYFDKATGTLLNNTFLVKDGKRYWYENGIRQGLEGRGKEICDPATGDWYWLDAVQDGAVATSKDVYQESWAGEYADNEDGTGKWVRYDEEGHMIKGWDITEAGTYYFDLITGAMLKGKYLDSEGNYYHFDENTGVLIVE